MPAGRPTPRGKPASDQVALAGPDGKEAARLLAASVRVGTAALGEITEGAVERMMARPNPLSIKRLFTDAERADLQESLSATIATAHLLGRARIRERMIQVSEFSDSGRLSRRATRFLRFDDPSIRPLPPHQALDYFRNLVPELGTDPKRFGAAMERHAFTLAAATDEVLLRRIQGVLRHSVETGGPIEGGNRSIERLLTDAGVSPKNPQYAEMVYRTNMMDAFNAGAARELRDPDVAEVFPVWRYDGIRDGRQGKDHEPRFGRYYPSEVSFASVRGKRVFNCRCSFTPIDKFEWDQLQSQGRQISTFSDDRHCFCGGKGGKPGPCPARRGR